MSLPHAKQKFPAQENCRAHSTTGCLYFACSLQVHEADAVDTLLAEAADGHSSMLSVGLHLRITGRPARFSAVRTILDQAKRRDGQVWIATRRDIAAHFKSQTPGN